MHTKEGRRSLGHAGGKRAVKESMEEEITGQKQLTVHDVLSWINSVFHGEQ